MQAENKSNNGFPLLSLLNQESINSVNEFLKKSGHGSKYKKTILGKNIRIIRTKRKLKFWDRLMRERKAVDL